VRAYAEEPDFSLLIPYTSRESRPRIITDQHDADRHFVERPASAVAAGKSIRFRTPRG
jgi:hypothetical protein